MSSTATQIRALLGGSGSEWTYGELPAPTAVEGQVLIRVRAAGLNRTDLYMLEGAYNNVSAHGTVYLAGREGAGVVEAVGDGVGGVAVGDRVMFAANGTFADLVVCDHRHVIPVPERLSWVEAASLPIALGTEHDALQQVGFRAGQHVLVLGATSSVGLIGVQMAKALGAESVIATTTSAAKADVLSALGADVVVNTREQSFVKATLDATGGRGVDIVLDHLAGQPLADALSATRIGGALINIGRLAGRRSTLSVDELSFRRIRLIGTTFSVRSAEQRAAVYRALDAEVLPAVERGTIRPVIDRTYSPDLATHAAAHMRSNTAIGKIVFDFS